MIWDENLDLTIEVFGAINWEIPHFENSFDVCFFDVDTVIGDEFL